MKTTWILASMTALGLAACLAGVKGDGGVDTCTNDNECGDGQLGEQCSSGRCVKTPCDPTDPYRDANCQAIWFSLVCDIPSESCVRRCVGIGDCPPDSVCEEGTCEDMGPTGTLGATNPTAVGPGAAGGPWSYPGDSPPDEGGDGNPYSDGDGY